MRKHLLTILLTAAVQLQAQGEWDVWQCMDYAVVHNHDVRKAALVLDNYKASRLDAAGDFLPNIYAGVGGQFNFGRAIDPHTNSYTDVSTFNNSYSLSASLPVFDGLARVHAFNAARADVLSGKSNLQRQKDQTALATFQAFVNVLYCQGAVRMAEEKLRESMLTLRQTRLMEEVGRKSHVDVAQTESQYAADDYTLTLQKNNLASAILALKKEMNYPLSDSISLKDQSAELFAMVEKMGTEVMSPDVINGNPELQQSFYAQRSARHQLRLSRSSLFPTISLSAGIGTNYNKVLHVNNTVSFSEQFKNNRGEYIGVSVSVPIFNRLNTLMGIRRAANNYRIACENYDQKRLELQKLSAEAVLDFHGYMKETEQLVKKVTSDSITYALVKRQYDEGLASAIDVQTSASALLNSRASLLKIRLMAVLKRQLVRYYTNS